MCYLFLAGEAGAQVTGLQLSFTMADIDLPAKSTMNAVALADALTANKHDEKEKFDAIFAWVGHNIRYNYKAYYSAGGATQAGIKRMLKDRAGICIDYAALMDTLCMLAGITNVSVYGYAKDEIFDVNDSIYIDNHAWNAVKLGGQWYLYDVTWASGHLDYRYTAFSRLLLKWDAKPESYRRKKIRKRYRLFDDERCGAGAPAYVYKQRFLNRLFKALIHCFSIKVKQVYVQTMDVGFYLTEPGLFSVTHFPDDPAWSLLPAKTMRNFETDSLFYHLEDSSYAGQVRAGAACAACDLEMAMPEPDRLQTLKSQSFMLNRRNRFVTALCDYSLAQLSYQQSSSVADSLAKISLLDTAQAYLAATRRSLKQCSKNVKTDFVLQKNKNRLKQNMLLKDNKKHIAFVKAQVNMTLAQRRKIIAAQHRSAATLNRYRGTKAYIGSLQSELFVNPKNTGSEKKIAALSEKLNRKEHAADSLAALIETYKARVDSALSNLSLNVWNKAFHHDSLIIPIITSSRLRKLVKDDYKSLLLRCGS